VLKAGVPTSILYRVSCKRTFIHNHPRGATGYSGGAYSHATWPSPNPTTGLRCNPPQSEEQARKTTNYSPSC
jgi:hypothetical protein